MKVSIFNRILSALIDFVFVAIMALTLDRLIATPIVNGIWNYDQQYETYHAIVEEYEKLQDKYEIYVYTEDEKRILNENVSEEQKEAFLQDQRVIEIKEEAVVLQNSIRKITSIELGIAFLLSLLFCYMLFPLIFKKRATLGKRIFHLVRCDKKGVLLRTPAYLLYNFCVILFHYIIGLGTFGLYLLANLVVYFVQKDHLTITDRMTKTVCTYDEDYIEASLVTKEKEMEK